MYQVVALQFRVQKDHKGIVSRVKENDEGGILKIAFFGSNCLKLP